jgi:hypothetical protein
VTQNSQTMCKQNKDYFFKTDFFLYLKFKRYITIGRNVKILMNGWVVKYNYCIQERLKVMII